MASKASVYIVVKVENRGYEFCSSKVRSEFYYESNVGAYLDEKQAVDNCRNRNELDNNCDSKYHVDEIVLDDE